MKSTNREIRKQKCKRRKSRRLQSCTQPLRHCCLRMFLCSNYNQSKFLSGSYFNRVQVRLLSFKDKPISLDLDTPARDNNYVHKER